MLALRGKLPYCGLVLVVVLFGLGISCEQPNREASSSPEGTEPPLLYDLEVNGKIFTLEEGRPMTLQGTFTDPQITLHPRPYRVFRCQGIQFEYPRYFTFEADVSDPSCLNWTLSGNDFKIFLFAFPGEGVTPQQYIEEIAAKFGVESDKITKAKKTLGKLELHGRMVEVTIAGHPLTIAAFQVSSKTKGNRLLVFQDSVCESGKSSKEAATVLKILEASFSVEE